mmetsp:Transcript_15408/g.26039  ORF Transcript_15408/g.26039 Transcript_15408/m.26039 type:complete len:209 (+) Transcript_15408:196-822(+)
MRDDAIVSIEDETPEQPLAKKPTFSNKNKKKEEPKKIDSFFEQEGKEESKAKRSGAFESQSKKERQLKKTNLGRGVDNMTLDQMESHQQDKNYDQFKNKKSTYDESLYTTQYDLRKITKEQKENAEKLSKEIEGADSKGNIFVAMDRGQVNQGEIDNEELMYGSGNVTSASRAEKKQAARLGPPKTAESVQAKQASPRPADRVSHQPE